MGLRGAHQWTRFGKQYAINPTYLLEYLELVHIHWSWMSSLKMLVHVILPAWAHFRVPGESGFDRYICTCLLFWYLRSRANIELISIRALGERFPTLDTYYAWLATKPSLAVCIVWFSQNGARVRPTALRIWGLLVRTVSCQGWSHLWLRSDSTPNLARISKQT